MKELRQMNLKKKIIFGNILMLIIIASVTGIKIFSNNKVEFIPIDEADERYQSIEIEKPEGAVVTDYFEDANKVLYITNYVCNHSPYYSSNYDGIALAKVAGINYKQKTIVDKVINNDEAFHQTLSLSSLVKVGEQRYVTPNTYLLRKGKNVSEAGATFDNNISAVSKEKFLELYGSTPFGMTQYILRDEYIISSSYVGEKDGLYSFRYEFVPFDTTVKYARQVKTMAGANGLPEFDRANFVLTVDKNFYVQKIEYDEYYDLPMMGGLKITLTATEKFVFSSTLINVPERSEFEPFFNATINDDEVSKKTGMTYLTEAFSPLLDGGSLNVLANVLYDGKNYPVHASVDMGNMIIDAALPYDITLKYDNNYIYLALGNNKLKIKASDLIDIISKYLPIDLDTISLDSLMDSPLLADAMNNMTEEITDNSCIIGMPLNDDIDCKIILSLNEQDEASLSKISATIKIEDEVIGVDVSFENDKYNYADIQNAVEITNLDSIIDNLIELFENKLFNIDLDFTYNDIKASGNVKAYINYEDIINSKAQALINVKYQDLDADLSIKYLDGNIAVSYENINIVLSVDDIMSLLDEFNISIPELPTIDVKEVVNTVLEKLDFNKLIKNISSDNDLSIILNLLSFVDFDKDIEISASDGIELEISDLGKISASKATDFEVALPTENVFGLDGINDLFKDVVDFIDNPQFNISFDGSYQLNDNYNLTYNGNIYLDINNLYLDVIANIELNDESTQINIKYIDNTIEITLFNKVFRFTIDEVLEIVEEVNDKFDLFDGDLLNDVKDILNGELPEINVMELLPTLIELLDSLNLSDEFISLDIDLDSFDLPLGLIQVLFDIKQEQININSDFVDIKVIKEENYQFALAENADITYDVVEKVLDFVYDILDATNLCANISYSTGDLSIDACVFVDLENIALSGKVMISYNDLIINAEVTFINDQLTIKIGNNVITLSIEEAMGLIIELNNKYNFIDNDIINTISDVLDGNLPEVDINQLIGIALPIIENLEINTEAINLPISYDNISLDVTYDFEQKALSTIVSDAEICVKLVDEVEINELSGNILTINGIEKIIDFVENILDSFLIKANYVFNYQFNEKDELNITGDIVFDIENLNLKATANAQFAGITAKVELVKVNDLIEAKVGNLVISLTIDDIYALLVNLHERYDILDLDTINLIVDLLKGVLPEIDLDVLFGIVPTLLNTLILSDNSINLSLDLEEFGLDLGNIDLNVDLDKEEVSIDNEMLQLNVDLLSNYEFSLFEGSRFTYEQVDYALDTIDAIIELIKNREFNLSVNGTVKNATTTTYQISGSLYLKLSDEEVLSIESIESMKAHLLLIDQKMQHDINLLLVDGMIYVTYTNYALNDTSRSTSKGTTKAYISFEKLLETLNYANQMFIKNNLLTDLVSSFGATLDTSVLDTVIYENNLELDLSNLIYNLTVSKTLLQVGINHDILNDYNPGGVATIQINNKVVGNDVEIDKIYVNNFYSGVNTVINLEADILNNAVDLTAPSTIGYIDLNSIADLLVKLNNTIEIKNYDLSGTITLSIADLFNLANVPLTLKISLHENDVKVYAKIEVPYVLVAIKDKTRTEIYYDSTESNTIYVKRSTYKHQKDLLGIVDIPGVYTNSIDFVEYKSQTASDFLADMIDNICYIFNMSDTIKNAITSSSESSGSGSGTTMYYADLVKSYTYNNNNNNNKYGVTINGDALTDGIISDLTATIKELTVGKETYLYDIEASTKVYSILSASVKGNLNNFNSGYSEAAFLQEMATYKLVDFIK